MSIKRLYVEKKEGCDIEAVSLFNDIKTNLNVYGLNKIRVLVRYDVEGISDEDFETAKTTIFSEPPVDMIYEESYDFGMNRVFAVEYLPGQYDQRADSAMQCVQIISQKEQPTIALAKVFVLEGDISDEDFDKIKEYCINPVDSREASLEKPETLSMVMAYPDDVKSIDGFIEMDERGIADLRRSLETAMSLDDMLFCQEYFKNVEKRNPTMTEIRVIDTYWSDHCRHTTFQTKIENVKIDDGLYAAPIKEAYGTYLSEREELYKGRTDKDQCLMDIAVIGMKALKKKGILNNMDESDEINACSIVVPVDVDGKEEEWLVMFKNETHNHPTEIEPFGGAATCLGGAIRDPLSGRSYVYQAMRVTGAADPRTSVKDTIKGKLPQRKIVTEAARGYSSYGNQIGLSTGQVVEIYDPDYVAKRMEIGAVIAAAKKENVVRKTPEPGDVIILAGGRTGRDGCGGATGSSKEHTVESIHTCGAEVQKGNPPTERKLQRLFRNPEVSKMIKRCNDFGAGGVSVAIGELADGLNVNLDLVPKKYEGLDGTELAISESQERMAVVVSAADKDRFIAFAQEENLEATPVAVVTDDRRLVLNWRGKPVVNISRDFLDTNGVKQKTDVHVVMPEGESYFEKTCVDRKLIENDFEKAWLTNLSRLNVASQKGLVERFDSTIGASTVLMPFGGIRQLTPAEAMAAKIPLLKGETNTVTIMSYGFNPEISKWSPFHGAIYAVVESLARIVACGGDASNVKLTFQEYFEKLGNDPVKWGKPFAALIGGFKAQMELGVAAIGGKDSMSGTFMDIHVPPTLVSFAVDVANVENIISPEFKAPGNTVVYIPIKRDKYYLPDFDYLKKVFAFVKGLIEKGICVSASTIKGGGIAEVISKMSFGNNIGFEFDNEMDAEKLFVPDYGSFILELSNTKVIDFMGLDAIIVGETTEEPSVLFNDNEITISDMLKAWQQPLEGVYPTNAALKNYGKAEVRLYENRKFIRPEIKIAKPKVFIPVFPGTNCEYDSARAFEKAGAEVKTQVIANMTVPMLEASIEKMVSEIKKSQIIMIPGGFSAGDEPDGSGKFIAAVFRNPAVKEAVMELLKNRDGLMLGICNGFQALIKLGLVPYGEIRDLDCDSPTLTFNSIGRHVSCLVDTKIVSTLSPWLWGTNTGEVYTIPVSHGEGRFVAPKEKIDELAANGQIATQYVDNNGNATYDIRFNPNGSMMAIEGITSPDGRVFGKMGHSERIGDGLYKNAVGIHDQRIFESGVDYFR